MLKASAVLAAGAGRRKTHQESSSDLPRGVWRFITVPCFQR